MIRKKETLTKERGHQNEGIEKRKRRQEKEDDERKRRSEGRKVKKK